MAEAGLLTPLNLDGARTPFDRDAAAQFRRDYVFSNEAATLLGVGKLTVQQWARVGRLKPVSGPGVDAGLRYVFRRGEVEECRSNSLYESRKR